MSLGVLHPAALALLLLPLLAIVVWRVLPPPLPRRRARLSLAIRAVLLALVTLAVAGLQVQRAVGAQTLVVVADRSASPQGALGDEKAMVQQLHAALHLDDRLAVVATARDAIVEQPASTTPSFTDFATRPNTNLTDLEAGLRLGDTLVAPDTRGHVVLVSDGRENVGDAAAQARLLRSEGVRVDVLPLHVPSGSEVLVDSLQAPSAVPAGARVHVHAIISSNVATTGRLSTDVDGSPADSRQVTLTAGQTDVDITLSPQTAGIHRVHTVIDPAVDTLAENNVGETLVEVLGTQRVAVVEGSPGAGANLAAALRAGNIEADVVDPAHLPATPDGIAGFNAIALVDVPAVALGQQRMESIRAAVRDLGVGLATFGGPDTYGPGGFSGTPIEDALPVTMEISDRSAKPPVAVVLVLESVENQQGDAVVRGAARSVVEHLTSRDYLGVTDSATGLAVPLTRLTDKAGVEAKIAGIQVFGDPPSYEPYLQAAGQALAEHPEATRHIILLGDGDAQQTSTQVVDSLVKQGVTISTVGVDIDRSDAQMAAMQAIAVRGKGRFYRSEDAGQVPTILLDETDKNLKPWIVQQQLRPVLTGSSPALAGIDLTAFPALGGYVATTARPAASVALQSPQRDPLLAEWQYGLGHVISWTSDTQGRWTTDLLTWAQGGRLLADITGSTLPLNADPGLSVTTRLEADRAHIVAEVADAASLPVGAAAAASVVKPDRTGADTLLSSTGLGRFEGDIAADQVGSYLVHVAVSAAGSTLHATTAGLSIAYSPEFRFLGTDLEGLRRIAAAGGGEVLDTPAQVVAAPLPEVRVGISLAMWLLAAAALLLPIDVALRRLVPRAGDAAVWRAAVRRRSRVETATAAASATVDRLRRRLGERRAGPAAGARPPADASPPPRAAPPGAPPATDALPREPEEATEAVEPTPAEAHDLAARLLARRRMRPPRA